MVFGHLNISNFYTKHLLLFLSIRRSVIVFVDKF